MGGLLAWSIWRSHDMIDCIADDGMDGLGGSRCMMDDELLML